ncbi:MAG: hypothetical protein U5K69_17710 [Balneolaceae bacterium]|nr:hypothetical protein [Balneolaceae bacterium]
MPSSWKDRLLFSHWNGNTSVRSQNYRLDNEGRLYDITKDRGQKHDISERFPQITQRLSDTLAAWEQQLIPKNISRDRPFPLGHAEFKYTQLPARDGIAHGSIKRSNRYPNASFFTELEK